MKRVALFVITNLAIVIMLGVVTSALGVNHFLSAQGLDLGQLLGFAAVIGFGGAIFSLLISKPVAKFTTGARTIEQPANAMEAWLLDTVRHHTQKVGLKMPEVAIYEGEPNAFATGAFRNSALVAISTGLLQTMSKEEVEAVLGHEVTHIANGDMVTMTLLQGVMNTFVVFLSNVLAYVIDRMILRNDGERAGLGYFAANLVFQLVFGLLASIVVMWFSRRREFRADAGSAGILGTTRPMMSALQRLGGLEPGELPRQISAFGINGGTGGLGLLFASHPPIEQRIAALRALGN
ncbi:MAG TPA: protease HtpX [Burkholderiaceae bacterium]|nr:protease HtpX [Burkholderiaceae bacterium]